MTTRNRPKPWTPEEDAQLLEIIVSMTGCTAAEIARAAEAMMGRPANGCTGRMRDVPHLREAVKPRPKPEPKRRERVEFREPTEAPAQAAIRKITLPPLPFDLPPEVGFNARYGKGELG